MALRPPPEHPTPPVGPATSTSGLLPEEMYFSSAAHLFVFALFIGIANFLVLAAVLKADLSVGAGTGLMAAFLVATVTVGLLALNRTSKAMAWLTPIFTISSILGFVTAANISDEDLRLVAGLLGLFSGFAMAVSAMVYLQRFAREVATMTEPPALLRTWAIPLFLGPVLVSAMVVLVVTTDIGPLEITWRVGPVAALPLMHLSHLWVRKRRYCRTLNTKSA